MSIGQRARRAGSGAGAALALVLVASTAGSQAPDIVISPEAQGVAQVVTAAQLAHWGRARGDAGALIMAARILGEVPMRPLEQGDEGDPPILTADGLLDEAGALADGDQRVLDAIHRMRQGPTRGVRSSPFGQGPIFMVREIKARETWGFDLEARSGEVLRVAAIGDGDTDIDLTVRDAAGAVVCTDGFGDHYPVCTLPRPGAGRMRIDIVNRGGVWTKVQVLSN